MLTQIRTLTILSSKEVRTVIGLMSGTSLDGLDIALCKIRGTGRQTRLTLEKFVSLPYDSTYRDPIRRIFAKRNIDLEFLCGLHPWVGQYHARLVLAALSEWQISPQDIDFIASHGQTIYHAPQSLSSFPNFPNSTLQIGDADHIALLTGIPTVSDFRQKHLAAGGEGAPLVPYGDILLFSHSTENRILLNIGGISNYTFLPVESSTGTKALASDIGPGNTLINQYMHQHFRLEMDKDAELALQGKSHPKLLTALLAHPFFSLNSPKTTGPELFNLSYLLECQKTTETQTLSHADTVRTLTDFTIHSIAASIRQLQAQLPDLPFTLYVSGGGLHNPLIRDSLQQHIPDVIIHPFDRLGIDPDAKEACLFAVLANETLSGNPFDYEIEGSPNVSMGKISLPY